MIPTIAYLLLVAGLLGLAARVGERLCAELDWPRRAAWLVALVASIALPAFAYFSGSAPSAGTPVLSLPPIIDQIPAINGRAAGAAAGQAQTASFNWPDWRAFDSTVAALWIASSAAVLLVYLLAALRVRRITACSRPLAIDDQTVWLSDRLGPAVLGFLRPRIVLPHWLAEQDSPLRSQVLNHEREHIAARDQLALLAALLIIAAMPWNVALWWQLRRLRAAIEVDCDRRVLRAGADARDYSKALLTVSQSAVRTPFAAVALTEPVSELEKRIRIMLDKARDFSPGGFGARFVVVVSMLGLAFALNAPKAQQADDGAGTDSARKVIPAIRPSVYEPLGEAQECLTQADLACVHRILDEIGDMPDLNTYETAQRQNFVAFASFAEDNPAGAIAAYETILSLPREELPDGLIASAMRNLAMLYLQEDRLQDGLDTYDRWLALPYVDASANDRFTRASILYQLERYPDAIAETERAIATSDAPREAWYQLLYALQSMTGDERAAASTLELLNTRWPDRERPEAAALGQSAMRETVFAPPDEYLPIVSVAPVYPPRAAARGIEGYVIVRYTVAANGSTQDVEVVESSSTLFENAALEAARKYKYKPRVIDGTPVEVAGVTSRIEFTLSGDG